MTTFLLDAVLTMEVEADDFEEASLKAVALVHESMSPLDVRAIEIDEDYMVLR